MKIIYDEPPMYDEIDAAFNVRGRKGVIFCWGDTIYVPDGSFIQPALRAHEQTHSIQQGTNPEAWWRLYINDLEFRLREEIEAHRTEYLAYCAENKDRNVRSKYLESIANRLAGPLYGGMISVRKARAAIAR